ncbi:hypothetical protein CHELA40_14023 [Chelatococcus asaccharovorans]|nr:hypothetical protein CHELA17_61603 [Chelatococcus asaccharovorans]CAH1674630.1 hypothetical protein CHELA40_14023 [Chelatococcus asaccharovorans]
MDLVVRRRHLHPPDTGLGANVGVKKTTSKLLVLVELLNLTFDLEPHVGRDSNVKFAPLGDLWKHHQRRKHRPQASRPA